MPTDSLIYNIPVELIEGYRGRRIIVRVYDPSKLVANLPKGDLGDLHYVQILTLAADVSVLANWGEGIPIDFVMYEPQAELPKLYNHAKLLDAHPVRVTMPVRRGLANAVKVAMSLQFSVRLTVGQPRPDEISQMLEMLEMYLRKPAMDQPVEFYRSLMGSFFLHNETSIWEIQEEDPSKYRFVTAQGQEIISPRFLEAKPFPNHRLDTYVDDFAKSLVKERRECSNCDFADQCMGYFKWPNKDYICSGGVKKLLSRLESAARDFKNDAEEYAAVKGGAQA